MNGYLGNLKILIVDDNAFMRSIVVRVMKALGAGEIIEATDGEKAIEKITNEKPDLMICDWQMEPMDGYDLIRHVRLDEESPDPFLPIIMMTGFGDREHVFKARDAGVTEFLVKPLSAKGLWSRLEAIIERPRPFVKLSTYFGPDRRRKTLDMGENDRRGKLSQVERAKAEASAAKEWDKTIEMAQQEINHLFNPDEKVLDQMSAEEREATLKKMRGEAADR